MIYKLKYNFLLLFFLTLVISCTDELWENNESFAGDNGLPVEFDINIPEEYMTRGVQNPKTKFNTGDMIHVEAIFYDENDNIIPYTDESGDVLDRVYKAYELNLEGKWTVVGNRYIAWPSDAKTGEFKAYYLSNLKSVLVKDAIEKELRLSDVDDQTDPLRAVTEKISWGHRVNLTFEHICTHLTFTGLDPDITDYFWLINNRNGGVFNNIFNLRYTADGKLQEDFKSSADSNYDNLIYVQQPSRNLYEDNIKTGSEVSFFLEPGDYSDVELRTINNYSYLAYQNDFTSSMEANVPYVVNIKQSKGVTFVEDDEDWDESTREVDILDPEEFLTHLVEGTEYEVEDPATQEKIRVLQQTSSGTRLRYNVSFGNSTKYVPKAMPAGRYFDGGNHYISDIAKNLFTINYGTIQHLGLKNINCEDELWYLDQYSDNHDSWGILCESNLGQVDNIKIEDLKLTFKLGTGKESSGTRFHIGAVAGSNSGTVSNIEYGKINIQSSNVESDNIGAISNIGGLVGQNTNLIKDISPINDDDYIKIIVNLSGDLQGLYVGGAVGQSSGNIRGISLPDVTIDISGSSGNISSVGGIAGRLRSNTGSPSDLISCTVKGEIKGMTVMPYGSIKGFSYTGGISGYNYDYNVQNCRAICNVYVSPSAYLSELITYATGGGFGRIISGENKISANYILGSRLEGPVSSDPSIAAYIGNFAGIVPAAMVWENYNSLGNVVNSIVSDNIGASIDDEIPRD